MTEPWIRSPSLYPTEVAESGHGLVAWDRGHLSKFKINPITWSELYLTHLDWRSLLVGEQGAGLYKPGDKLHTPTAVYPVWIADRDSFAELCSLAEEPAGTRSELCFNEDIPVDVRPVLGQENRVVIINTPNGVTGECRRLIKNLQAIKQEYGDHLKLHLHGNSQSYSICFGKGFDAASVACMRSPRQQEVFHPGGAYCSTNLMDPMWPRLFGMEPTDLKTHKGRTLFNIRAAIWAAENYENDVNFATKRYKRTIVPVDPDSPDAKIIEGGHILKKGMPPLKGDKWTCNSCSLSPSCKFFRLGSVCIVPGAEPAGLAKKFNTRDASDIVDGLSQILVTTANRLQQGMENEANDSDGKLDPEVTKISNQLFQNGVKLAQLIDPSLRPAGAKIQINNMNGGAIAQSPQGPSAIISAAVRALEAKGFAREDITTDLLASVLPIMREPEAIDGEVI